MDRRSFLGGAAAAAVAAPLASIAPLLPVPVQSASFYLMAAADGIFVSTGLTVIVSSEGMSRFRIEAGDFSIDPV